MSSSSQRTRTQPTSYVEVDSDVDMDSEDERVTNEKRLNKLNEAGSSKDATGKKAGDTFGAGQDDAQKIKQKKMKKQKLERKKKFKRDSQAFGNDSEEEEEDEKVDEVEHYAQPSLERFLTLPLDTIVEICTHLEGGDLLNLARTSKDLRTLFHSDTGKLMWSRARAQDGLPSVEGRSDRELVGLLHGKHCKECASPKATLDLQLFQWICDPCRKSIFVRSTQVKKNLSPLHPVTLKCVQYTNCLPPPSVSTGPTNGTTQMFRNSYRSKTYYRRETLEQTSELLWELDAEDEETSFVEARPTGTKSRPAPNAATVEPTVTRVESFVGKKVAELKTSQELSEIIRQAVSVNLKDKARQAAQRLQKRRTLIEARKTSILAKLPPLGNIELSDLTCMDNDLYDFINQESPLTDDEWNSVEPGFLQAFEVAKSDKARYEQDRLARQRIEARKTAVLPYYDTLRSNLLTSVHLPAYHQFLEMPIIKPFWEPDGAVFNADLWNVTLADINTALVNRAEALRLEADAKALASKFGVAKVILAASGTPSSMDPATVNLEDTFFSRATSVVLCPRHRYGWSLCHSVFSGSDYLRHAERDHYGDHFLVPVTRPYVVKIMLKILATAGLTPTSSFSALNNLAPRFRWKEYTGRGKETFIWTDWRALVVDLYRLSKKKRAQPLTLELVPQATSN